MKNIFNIDIESLKYPAKFDFIFSMESLYYVELCGSSIKKNI